MKVKTSSICILLLIIHMLFLVMNGTQYFSIGDRAYIYLLIIVICILSMLSKKMHFDLYFSSERRICVIMIGYIMFSINTVNQNYQNDTFLAACLFFILLFFWTSIKFSFNQIMTLRKYYIFSALILSIGILFMRYKPYPGFSRMSIKSYTGEFYDVNFLSAYIVVSTILLMQEYFEERRKLTIVMLLTTAVAVVLTGSRGALGVMAIGFAVILFKQKKITFKVFCTLIALIFSIPFIIQFIPDDIFIHFLKGMNFLNDTRRMEDWMSGIRMISLNPLLGHGLASTQSLIQTILGVRLTVHNTYLAFLVNFGLIFGSLVIILMVFPLYSLIKYKAPYIYPLAYGMFLLSILLIEANFSDIMIIPMCVFFSFSNYYKQIGMENRFVVESESENIVVKGYRYR